MNQFPTIYLDKGGTSVVDVDLTGYDFAGGNLVFTMKAKNSTTVLKEETFTTPGVHCLVFDCDFTKNLLVGKDVYEYDFFLHVDGERFKQCEPSPIVVGRNVGGKKR